MLGGKLNHLDGVEKVPHLGYAKPYHKLIQWKTNAKIFHETQIKIEKLLFGSLLVRYMLSFNLHGRSESTTSLSPLLRTSTLSKNIHNIEDHLYFKKYLRIWESTHSYSVHNANLFAFASLLPSSTSLPLTIMVVGLLPSMLLVASATPSNYTLNEPMSLLASSSCTIGKTSPWLSSRDKEYWPTKLSKLELEFDIVRTSSST